MGTHGSLDQTGLEMGHAGHAGLCLARSCSSRLLGRLKAKKAADRIAATSAGKMNTEVRDAFLEAVKAAGLKTITASEISVSRNGQGWDVEVEYQVSRKLGDKVDLIFDFSISSDRAGLWASNNQS